MLFLDEKDALLILYVFSSHLHAGCYVGSCDKNVWAQVSQLYARKDSEEAVVIKSMKKCTRIMVEKFAYIEYSALQGYNKVEKTMSGTKTDILGASFLL